VTPSPTPTSTPTIVATPALFQGFVPPDKVVKKCEDTTAADLMKLAACLRACHAKRAGSAAKGKPFDEEACESGSSKSCRGKYDTASGALIAKGICPPCLDATALAGLADAVEPSLETEAGNLYCAGTTSLGGDDPGFVPPDGDVQKCELAVAKSTAALATCTSHCQIKQAGTEFKHKPFDKAACESAGASSCRGKFDAASTKLEAKAICPPCLGVPARAAVADTARNVLEQRQERLYCAGSRPLQ
jgi:hypothetical protein